MAVVMKPCSHCGELYPTKRSTSKYCSARCQSASFRAVQEVKPYTIKHKHPSQISKEKEMSVTKQQEIRLRMHGIDVTILVDHRPADESLPNMTSEEIKAYVESAIANLMTTGDIHA